MSCATCGAKAPELAEDQGSFVCSYCEGQTFVEPARPPDVGSDFAFPRPLRPMTCRASERTASGFTRDLASTAFIKRGFSDSTLGLEGSQSTRFGEIRTSLVSFSPRTTYGIFWEPSISARIPELGREKIRLNCQ